MYDLKISIVWGSGGRVIYNFIFITVREGDPHDFGYLKVGEISSVC